MTDIKMPAPILFANSTNSAAHVEESMANKTTMPEPVGWYRPSEDGCDSSFRDHSTILSCPSNPWEDFIPLITTDQAEAYKDACVREALEEAANVAKQITDKYAYGYYGNEVDTADEIEAGIRALIPPTK